MLHGHERAITQIKYNREGDLLFSTAKDSKPNVWYSLNGERLGSFNGHNGAVWCIDVNWNSTRVVTGAADNSLRLWDCQTGTQIGLINTKSAVRSCGFSYCGKYIMYTTDRAMGNPCEVTIIDCATADNFTSGASEPVLSQIISDFKITSALWGPLDQYLVLGNENGDIYHLDVKSGERVKTIREHSGAINDLQYSKDQTMFISSSKDTTAKLFDTASLDLMKTFKTERPVNSAAVSPILPHVVVGGGQEARDVTTTSSKEGKFEARFFHTVFEEEFGRVRGHFGPINSIAFHPDGKSYSSGGEDGYVRLHTFDKAYYDFQIDF